MRSDGAIEEVGMWLLTTLRFGVAASSGDLRHKCR